MSFEKFKKRLANKCTLALATGVKIGESMNCRCPMGVETPRYNKPSWSVAAAAWGIHLFEAGAFARGFDGAYMHASATPNTLKFFELGKAYRRKFVERVK